MDSLPLTLAPLNPASRFGIPEYRSHSQSPPRSPSRREHFAAKEADPLLSNLSPSSTLEALRAADAVSFAPNVPPDVLSDSISGASTSERALGIRAALAGKKLREWCTEVQGWHWPSSKFEPHDERLKGRASDHTHGDAANRARASDFSQGGGQQEETFLGSLPVRTVLELEERIEDIRDEMDALDVEELKEHVRGAHLIPESRPTSSYGGEAHSIHDMGYKHLDDFTVVVTATILQALPYIPRLNKLLDVWSVRFLVLRQVPEFLALLDDAKVAVNSAWSAIGGHTVSDLTRDALETMRTILQERVADLGERLDSMLDSLEGYQDRLPDHWIDSMESVQEDYENWVVEAKARVEQNELLAFKESSEIALMGTQKREPKTASSQDITSAPPQARTYNAMEGLSLRPAPVSEILSTVDRHGDSPEHPLGLHHEESSLEPDPPNGKGSVSGPRQTMASTSEDTGSHDPSIGENDFFGQGGADQARQVDTFDGALGDINQLPKNKSASNGEVEPKPSTTRKPARLDLSTERDVVPQEHSSTSEATSATSSAFSDMSSPQIFDAESIQFFKTPMEEKFPPWITKDMSADDMLSRHSSQRTNRSINTIKGHNRAVSAVEPLSRSRASSYLSDRTFNEQKENDIIELEEDEYQRMLNHPNFGLKRASTTSIDSLPRSELRNIHIRRSSSASSARPVTSERGGVASKGAQENAGTLSDNRLLGTHQFRSHVDPSHGHRKRLSSVTDASGVDMLAAEPPSPSTLDPPDSEDTSHDVPAVITSQEEKNSQSDPSPVNSTSSQPKTSSKTSDASTEDQLTAKINSILDNIPAQIRLALTPDAEKQQNKARATSAQLKSGDNKTTPTRTLRSFSSITSPTLEPAYSRTPNAKQQLGDPEIKLYHLHQPGKDIPIKLFVRMVSGRVMVRVGGGWADLGEYLKEYANHHGRRSVSEGKFEIKGLQAAQSVAATAMSAANGRSLTTTHPDSPTYAPNSALPNRKVRRSSGAGPPHSPYTPEMPSRIWNPVTPGSTESFASSTRSSSRLSRTDEAAPLGLAGPQSRNVDISPQKKAWVDGMMTQARQVSYENKRVENDGDTGGVGSTRRVFLRTMTEEGG